MSNQERAKYHIRVEFELIDLSQLEGATAENVVKWVKEKLEQASIRSDRYIIEKLHVADMSLNISETLFEGAIEDAKSKG